MTSKAKRKQELNEKMKKRRKLLSKVQYRKVQYSTTAFSCSQLKINTTKTTKSKQICFNKYINQLTSRMQFFSNLSLSLINLFSSFLYIDTGVVIIRPILDLVEIRPILNFDKILRI